jgi:betaine-aldehyde dehydrogenase
VAYVTPAHAPTPVPGNPEGATEIVSRFPHDGSEVGRVPAATPAEVDRAARRAAAAMADPAWRDLLPHERARVLRAVGDAIEADAARLAELQTLDSGKPITETRALVASAAGTFRFFAAVCETQAGAVPPARGPYVALTHHVPVGVVGAITPWNSPIASEAQKVAPALAAGCAVLLKPSEETPLVAGEVARLAAAAGLPDGLLTVLPGDGAVGEAVVDHPAVRRVSFTGGTATGRRIAARCAPRFVGTSLELGGKGPALVFPDARRTQAIAGAVFGAFGGSGQACVASSRLLVHRSIFDEVLDAVVAAAVRLPVGDPRRPETRVGPLISQAHRSKVLAYVERAAADGATVHCGGGPPADRPDLAAGAYVAPTVLSGLPPDHPACTEEIFGPVVVVLPFDDEDDAARLADGTAYGLSATVWTADVARAIRLSRRIRAGTTWVNTTKQLSVASPFGGEGDSGIGREKGLAGIRQYQSERSLYLGLDDAPLPFAGLEVN